MKPFKKLGTFGGGSGTTSKGTADKDYEYVIGEASHNNGGQTFKVECKYTGGGTVLWNGPKNNSNRTGDGHYGFVFVSNVRKGDTIESGYYVNGDLSIGVSD